MSKESTIAFVKLSTLEHSKTCYNVKRISRHFHPSTTLTWVEIHDLLFIMVSSSQEIEMN